MFRIINLRYGDIFSSPNVISSHQTIGAAIKKAEHLFRRDADVFVLFPGTRPVTAFLFSEKQEDLFMREAGEIGLLDVKTYYLAVVETGHWSERVKGPGLVESTYTFDTENGGHNRDGKPIIWGDEDFEHKMIELKTGLGLGWALARFHQVHDRDI